MKKSLDSTVIQDVALELGIDPAFIEKDWYAVQLLVLISELQNNRDVKIVFSGGTSLSKGYGLIKRFSEDLDFILTVPNGKSLSVGQRRAFRQDVVSAIQSDGCFSIEKENILRGNNHNFFKIPIQYNRVFDGSFLRPHLQLEMTFMELKRPALNRSIYSIISDITQGEPELKIDCVSAIETAGDKLSALTWRILIRDRASEKDDPTMIRHLHDLAALEAVIKDAKSDFVVSAQESLQRDQAHRGGELIAEMPISDRLVNALNILKEDSLYRTEYEHFVESMSYALEAERIGFDDAVLALERIIEIYNQ